VEEQARKIRTAFLNAITALVYALEAKDEYTSGHSQRVAEISVAISEKMNLPQFAVEQMRLAGSVHDIGKIGIREAILNKPSGLSLAEYRQLKSHCEAGERILAPVVEEERILKAVKHHHEHYDGTGYPDGLSGLQIPLGARILAVADAYDAMTSQRPYREAMNPKMAGGKIAQASGTQFDPEVVLAFLGTEKAISCIVKRHRIHDYRALSPVGR
jgi:HD-GYP domain-containing protein (c-di-GMP phosphodiesterase class II)